jgi:DNA-binding CsgD family transcriptional regulator
MPAPSLPAAFVAFAAGDLGAAEQHLCRAIERMVTTGASAAWARLHSALTLAAIASKQEQHDEAARIFGSVYAQAATLGVSTETGSWRWCEDGQLDATHAALGEALFAQLWDQGSTLNWEELAAYVLRGRGARKRPTWGWDSLTPTELLVVELVAEGLGNREIAEKLFISVPTVKSHLTHVYTKLSMRSPSELGTAYVRRAASTSSPQQT